MPINVLDLLKYRLSPAGSSQELEALNNALPHIRQRQPDVPRSYGEAEMIPVPNTGYQTQPFSHPMFRQEEQAQALPQRENRLMGELDFSRRFRPDWPAPEGGWVSSLPPGVSALGSPLNLMRNPWALY